MDLFRFLESSDDIPDFLAWVAEQENHGYITVDTETTGLDTYDPTFSVRMVQFGSEDYAWLMELPRWVGLVDDVLQRFNGKVIIHNSSYDVPALGTHGIHIPWHKIVDTMLALRLYQPTERAGLKVASKRLLGTDGDGEIGLKKAMSKQKWTWATIPMDFGPYRYYGALDVVMTSRLYKLPELQPTFDSSLFGMEMDVRAIASEMEQNGMRIDLGFSEEKLIDLQAEAAHLKELFEPVVSLTSTQALGHWYAGRDDDRHLLVKRTPAGRLSMDSEVLKSVVHSGSSDGAKVAKAVLRVRKIEKIASSYFENFLSDHHDGVLHPQIETLAARTGRMSIRRPALQTLPKPSSDPESRIVRQAVIPLREGEALLSADMDQIELRIAASLSGDKELMNGFKTGDFFLTSAQDIYRDPDMVKSDDRRGHIKTFWYSALYGAGVETMAIRAGVPTERMTEIKEQVGETYPGFFKLQLEMQQEARDTGGVVTPDGRFLPVDEGKIYAATNFKIQASAADILKRSLVSLGNAGFGPHMLVPVHDEVVFSLPEKDIPAAQEVIIESMESHNYRVPLTAGINGPSDTWAGLT